MKLLRRIGDKLLVTLGAQLERMQDGVAASTLPEFATPAPGLVIRSPREIANPHLIHFGRDVKLGPNSVIKATTAFPGGWLKHPEGEHVSQEFTPTILFGDRVTATSGLQVVGFERIVIEDDVMFAGNVYLSDGQHSSRSGEVPYKFQGIGGIAPVTVGRGSWIGQNVVILPGVTIGEYAVVGANSVVNRSVPAQSLAVGSPARVVRSWDSARSEWVAPEETRLKQDVVPASPAEK